MRLILAMLIACLFSSPSFAKSHHHYKRHHVAHRDYHGIYKCASCVLRDTLAGMVSVSKENADRIVATINDLVHAGFKGPVHCAAPYGTHVRNSKHYSGNACDMAQTGWGKTTAHVMYTKTADAIIRKHGFTNGCSFRDCGHFGTDGISSHRYAHHRRKHYAHA